MDGLLKRGYVRGDSPPMYELEKPFADFEEYSGCFEGPLSDQHQTGAAEVRHRWLPIRASDEPARYSTRLHARRSTASTKRS